MDRSCCRARPLQPLVPHRQLAYQSIRVGTRGIGGEMFFLGRGPPVPERRKRGPVPTASPAPTTPRGRAPSTTVVRDTGAVHGDPHPPPRSPPPARVPGCAGDRSAERSSRTAHSARSRRATAARSPGRAAGPPRRTAPRAWPDRPAAVRARRRVRPRGGTRGCSCPIPRGRLRRSAGPARRTAPGCAAGKRGARGRSCGPAYEPVRSNRRSRQWTRPILVRRHTAIRWPNPAVNRNSWRTVVHPQPHSAYDRGFRP